MIKNEFETNQDLFGLPALDSNDIIKINELSEKLNLLYQMGQKLGEISSLSELFSLLLDSVCKVIGAKYGSIMLPDDNSEMLRIVASSGLSENIIDNTEIEKGDGIAGYVFENCKPVWVPDIESDTFFKKFLKKNRKELSKSFLSAPIIFKNENLGVINLTNKINGEFNREDLNILIFLSNQLAIAIKNSMVLEDFRLKAKQNKVLYRLSDTLNSSLSFSTNLLKFFKLLAKQLELEEIGIALYNKKKKSYKFKFGFKMNSKKFQQHLRHVFLNENQEYYLLLDDEDKERKFLYFQPLIYEREILGIFVFTKKYYDHKVSLYDFTFIKSLANQLSISIKKEELAKKNARDARQLKQINQYIKIISEHSFEIDKVAEESINIIRRLFSPDIVAVYLASDSPSLTVYSAKGNHEEISKTLVSDTISQYFPSFNIDMSLLTKLGKSNESKSGPDFKFQFSAPLISNSNKLGVLMLASVKERYFDERDQRQFFILSNHLSTAYENFCLFRKNERLAFTDPMTNLRNFRYFMQVLKKEFSRSKRYQRPLSIIMMDIDFFKVFNDSYGHQQGDVILNKIGELLNQSMRLNVDTVARYGGEEFVVILPDTDPDGATYFAERIRKKIESFSFPDYKKKRKKHKVTVSLGVSTYNGKSEISPESLISSADKALYISKEEGRNRVTFIAHEK